ncbi:hypothetical protein RGR602_PC00882 (plasmid) [Rhizobium gallicum bv. gallicum R602sp]|uniref:Uncharacterized protein n=1 Tax=Rhizobium gallicum bv. gallicum R602sp TaxID=1041138 RepID=A0A0B4XCS2_9HYPH|nr:hypothetical protein RGR602_PC00882 [Rhizobium gallicum bv. gallicum R602sp]
MVNLFDPEIIVVDNGGIRVLHQPKPVADWVPSSWARGAAALAAQNSFDFEGSPRGW